MTPTSGRLEGGRAEDSGHESSASGRGSCRSVWRCLTYPPGVTIVTSRFRSSGSLTVPFILALDEGTTSARAIVFDHDGTIKAVAQKEFEQIFPKAGWVEHDPEEIWTTQIDVAVEVLSRAGLRPSDIAAVGITNQRETTVVWDRATGRPIHNAIVWQDRRTAPLCDRLRSEGLEPLIQQRTGLLLDPYFSGPKLAWVLENVAG